MFTYNIEVKNKGQQNFKKDIKIIMMLIKGKIAYGER